MTDAQLTLELLKTVLSPQVIAGVVVTIIIWRFKDEMRALMERIAKIRLPGGGELSMSQSEKAIEVSDHSDSEQLKPSGGSVDLPETLSLTPKDVDIVREAFRAERANTTLWEYRYLNYFFAKNTQDVLDWLASLETGTSIPQFGNTWTPLIPNPNERSAIIEALQSHYLIEVSGEQIAITEKGLEYVEWRGPLSKHRD